MFLVGLLASEPRPSLDRVRLDGISNTSALALSISKSIASALAFRCGASAVLFNPSQQSARGMMKFQLSNFTTTLTTSAELGHFNHALAP